MKRQRQHNISFPALETRALRQDQAYFLLKEGAQELQIRFHDYGEIYKRPGLYEELFYERLKCNSPQKAYDIVSRVLRDNHAALSELRLLDLGAGNGMVGELFQAARTVGIDISPEAYAACERDRPNAYDAYYVADLCNLDAATEEALHDWRLDSLTCIAALGFGDIPPRAFAAAFNLIQSDGWVCFNVKESFLRENDQSDFSRLVKHLLVNDVLEVHHLERYRHRLSIDGEPLFYYMLAGKKQHNILAEIVSNTECA
jgi:hypothetical protein